MTAVEPENTNPVTPAQAPIAVAEVPKVLRQRTRRPVDIRAKYAQPVVAAGPVLHDKELGPNHLAVQLVLRVWNEKGVIVDYNQPKFLLFDANIPERMSKPLANMAAWIRTETGNVSGAMDVWERQRKAAHTQLGTKLLSSGG
jgi:hypothetical protein